MIKIVSPSENEADYLCRKGFYALNVQVNKQLKFWKIIHLLFHVFFKNYLNSKSIWTSFFPPCFRYTLLKYIYINIFRWHVILSLECWMSLQSGQEVCTMLGFSGNPTYAHLWKKACGNSVPRCPVFFNSWYTVCEIFHEVQAEISMSNYFKYIDKQGIYRAFY